MDRVVQNFDVDDEERLERVAAIDVAKASGNVCVRLPGGGRRVTKLWDVPSTTTAILTLADELVGMGVGRTVMESTSDYWRPFFYLLEVTLPRFADHSLRADVPGRESSCHSCPRQSGMSKELQVRRPSVPIVFTETRQLAEEWTYRYFAADHTWASTELALAERIGSGSVTPATSS